jgi:hypothetical protein
VTARFGEFGDTLASLTDNGFFRWFMLRATGEMAGPGETVYRPGSEVFGPLVALVAQAAPTGALLRLELRVERAFLADPRRRASACDILRSFILAVAADDAGRLQGLADEIMFRDPGGPILMRGSPPSLTAPPSPGYLVVAGRRARWDQALTNIRLMLVDDGARLMASAEPLGAGSRGMLSRLFGWISSGRP